MKRNDARNARKLCAVVFAQQVHVHLLGVIPTEPKAKLTAGHTMYCTRSFPKVSHNEVVS